jgi:hypothetical protein
MAAVACLVMERTTEMCCAAGDGLTVLRNVRLPDPPYPSYIPADGLPPLLLPNGQKLGQSASKLGRENMSLAFYRSVGKLTIA